MGKTDNPTPRTLRYRETSRRRREAGLCTKCGQAPPREGRDTCASCEVKNSSRRLGVVRRKRSSGYCGTCLVGVPAIGYKTCDECLCKQREKIRERRANDRCTFCDEPAAPGSDACSRHLEARKVAQRSHTRRLKIEVLQAYGGLLCACCGETSLEFLQVDHIHGNGNRHRRTIHPKGGTPFYVWLKKMGFPPGFRTLCANCNVSRGIYGYCPHEHGVRVDVASAGLTAGLI